jgi:hypothetical protein
MQPGRITAALADAHRHDLLREAHQTAQAAQAAQAAQVRPPSDDRWSTAMLLVSRLLVAAGHRLRAHTAHLLMARSGAIPCAVAACRPSCLRNSMPPQPAAWLDL